MNSHVSDTDEQVLVHVHVSDITKLKWGLASFIQGLFFWHVVLVTNSAVST